VTVAGGVTASKALALVKKYFGEVGRQKGKGQPAFPKFTAVQTEPQVKLVTKKTDQAHLILGFRGDGRDYAGRYAQGLLATILGGGMSSRLFLEIRERRGLAYSVKTSYERYQEVGYMDTYAGVNIKKVDLALRVILTEHQKLVAKGLTIKNAELSKAKEYLKGHFVLALEDTRAVSALYADQALFLPKIETPEAILQKVDQVTTAEVQYEARRLFKPDRLNLAIIGPFSNPEKFVKILS
jgi:predicted Zn-dependent peptidase